MILWLIASIAPAGVFKVNSGAMQVSIAESGEVVAIKTQNGFEAPDAKLFSFAAPHAGADSPVGTGSGGHARVNWCTNAHRAVCVERKLSIKAESGETRAIEVSDRFSASHDGAVKWETTFSASKDDATTSPFRLILGTSAEIGIDAADQYWVPRARMSPPPSPPSPYPRPSLAGCSPGDSRQHWSLNASGYPEGTIFSEHSRQCLLTWAASFSPSGCAAAPDVQVDVVLYECSRGGLGNGFTSCPGFGNQVWALDSAGRLVNIGVPPANRCLDPTKQPPTMTSCTAGREQRWRAIPVKGPGATAVTLESVARPGRCLSTEPPAPPGLGPTSLDMETEAAALSYGAETFLANVGGDRETRGRDAVPVPIAVFVNTSVGASLAIAFALNDTTIAAGIDARTTGLEMRRYNNLLGMSAPPVRFTAHFVASRATDWRPGYGWFVKHYGDYFQPTKRAAAAAREIGLGMYSCADVSGLNVSALQAIGASVIWDAHFWQALPVPRPFPNGTCVSIARLDRPFSPTSCETQVALPRPLYPSGRNGNDAMEVERRRRGTASMPWLYARAGGNLEIYSTSVRVDCSGQYHYAQLLQPHVLRRESGVAARRSPAGGTGELHQFNRVSRPSLQRQRLPSPASRLAGIRRHGPPGTRMAALFACSAQS